MLTPLWRPSLCASWRLPLIGLARHPQISPRAFAHTKNDTTRHTAGQRAISLLEELFPQNTNRENSRTEEKPVRHVPKLPLDAEAPSDAFDTQAIDTEQASAETAARKFLHQRHNRQLALLVLRKASKFLTESDFRRAAPTGKYIDGWAFQGDILKVIRGRDAHTLERDGVYYLMFENPMSAQAYRDHVMQLHRFSQAQLPQGLTGPIPPPPSIDASGQISYGPTETYTLIPPSQDLDLRMIIQPFSPLLKEVVDNFGYKQLADGKHSDHEVLITVHWMLLSLGSLKRAIRRDGENRGCTWAIVKAHGNDTALRTVRDRPSSSPSAETSKPETSAGETRRHGKKRFIVSFRDDAEAKRFAFSWNRREISDLLGDDIARRGQDVMVYAELVW